VDLEPKTQTGPSRVTLLFHFHWQEYEFQHKPRLLWNMQLQLRDTEIYIFQLPFLAIPIRINTLIKITSIYWSEYIPEHDHTIAANCNLPMLKMEPMEARVALGSWFVICIQVQGLVLLCNRRRDVSFTKSRFILGKNYTRYSHVCIFNLQRKLANVFRVVIRSSSPSVYLIIVVTHP